MRWKEADRLAALARLGLMDTPAEAEFDEIVAIAAAICDTAVSAISLVDSSRQWLKATIGIPRGECPRSDAFCSHTVEQNGTLQVRDATLDARFAGNPYVLAEGGIRFYAGVPVRCPEGAPLGALCVVDTKPRVLSEAQVRGLEVLARQVSARFELREQRRALERAMLQLEEAHAAAAASEQRFQAFMDSGPFVAFLKDAGGRMVYYNEPFRKKFSIERDEWLGKTDAEIWGAELGTMYRTNDLHVLTTGRPQVAEEESINTDGSRTYWRSHKFPVADANRATLLGGIAVDITEDLEREKALYQAQLGLQTANGRLRHLAARDPLTGLYNRRVFDLRLDEHFDNARRSGAPLSVLMLDVDNFKQRNDQFGHGSGDALLQSLAGLLQTAARGTDVVARYGGEEFILLLPGCTEAQALQSAGRILSAVRAFAWKDGAMTVSIGAAELHPSTRDPERLVSLADEALYAAKRAGKDQVVGASESLQRALEALERTEDTARKPAAETQERCGAKVLTMPAKQAASMRPKPETSSLYPSGRRRVC